MKEYKPTKEELQNARDKVVPDVIKNDLKILFCGINPGLYTAATGFHFARPGNRFWPALYNSGLTKELLKPWEQEKMLESGFGITNFVMRTTNSADELSKEEFIEGSKILEQKVLQYQPKILAVLGIGAFKIGFGKKNAKIGLQDFKIGNTKIWILPNPSGLNASFTPQMFAELFSKMKKDLD